MQITLKKDKVTPGTVRFKEDSEDHPITIYLLKSKVEELGNPETLTITIEAA